MQGKTFLTAIFCVTRSILFAETKIIGAAGQKSQAREIIQKIDDLRKQSPNLQREISSLKVSVNDSSVEFHNGSWIRTVAANDGARGNRSNLLIVDEYRLVDIDIINTVLRKFQTAPRQPKYLSKPEYAHLQERNKEIYLSSAYFKSHPTYERIESYTNSMVNGKSYFTCSLPYQIAIKEGLLMREQVEDEMQETTFNEISWLMEMESLFYGQSTKSIFKFDDLHRARKVGKCFYPKEVLSMINDKEKTFAIPKKENGEIRILSADIAVMSGNQNDSTAITVARLIPKKSHEYSIEIVYLESIEGMHTGRQALRIKQLYHDMNIDTIVIDRAGSGIGVLDALMETTTDTERGVEYEALSVMNNDDLAKRCMYSNAPKVIYAIHATADLNSDMALKFKDALVRNKIKIPMPEDEGFEFLNSSKGYEKLPLDVKQAFKMPYIHTSLFINEVVNLEAEINDVGRIKLKEARSARKDRYSSTSYLVYYVMEELEVKGRKRKSSFDPSQLFMVKTPKPY